MLPGAKTGNFLSMEVAENGGELSVEPTNKCYLSEEPFLGH